MPRIAVEENERVALRLRAGDKAKIMGASALKNMDLTRFMVHTALAAAEEVIEQAERLKLTGRDSFRILELLDNPPCAECPSAGVRARVAGLSGRRCLRVAEEAGGTVMLIDAKDERVAAWYASYRSVSLLDAPLILVLPLRTIAAALKSAGKE